MGVTLTGEEQEQTQGSIPDTLCHPEAEVAGYTEIFTVLDQDNSGEVEAQGRSALFNFNNQFIISRISPWTPSLSKCWAQLDKICSAIIYYVELQ